MTFKPTGYLEHSSKVDPARPFVLTIPRSILDGRGRPIRGVSWVYTYEDEASALADFHAAKKAKVHSPLLRDFTDRLAGRAELVRVWK